MKDQIHIARAATDNADEFESVVQPVVGAVRTAPKYRNRFSSSINVARLHRLGMVLLDIELMHTVIEPQYNFYCLAVPIVNSCPIKDISSRREYSRHKAHLLYPDRALDCHHSGKSRLLGVTFMIDNLDDIARKLLGSASVREPLKDCCLSLTTPAGVNLVNLLSHICGQMNRDRKIQMSNLTAVELEDDLIIALLVAMDESSYLSPY